MYRDAILDGRGSVVAGPSIGGGGFSAPTFIDNFLYGGGGSKELTLQKPLDPFASPFEFDIGGLTIGGTGRSPVRSPGVNTANIDGSTAFLSGLATLTGGVLNYIGSNGDQDVQLVEVAGRNDPRTGANGASGGGMSPLMIIAGIAAVGGVIYFAAK